MRPHRPYPSSPARAGQVDGFTLIETAILLSLIGVAFAVAVPTFVRTLRTSKISEASRQLQRIYTRAAAYYATPQETASGKRLRCLAEPAGPTPAEASVDPVEVVFGAEATPGAASWTAIGFEPGEPIRYRYSQLPAQPGCGAPTQGSGGGTVLTLRAEGDLDADGTRSLFERHAVAGDGELVPHGPLVVEDRVE